MANTSNIFTLRFFGDDITPSSFSAKELGELIISFHEGITSLIYEHYPSIESGEVKISLVGIENKSQSLNFEISEQKEVIQAVNEYAKSIVNGVYTDLPEKTYKSVRHIFGVAKRKACNAELVQRGSRLFVVSPDDNLIDQDKVLVKSNLVLYGELNKIGGDKSRAWVHLFDGSKLSFRITDEQLIKLRGKTKETIGIKGEARWNTLTKKVVSFKLKEVIDYSSGGAKKGFDEIKSITAGFWDTLNTNSEIYNHLRGDS